MENFGFFDCRALIAAETDAQKIALVFAVDDHNPLDTLEVHINRQSAEVLHKRLQAIFEEAA